MKQLELLKETVNDWKRARKRKGKGPNEVKDQTDLDLALIVA